MKRRYTILCLMAVCMLFGLSRNATAQVTIYSQNFSGTYPWGMTTSDITGFNSSHIWVNGAQTGKANQTGGTGEYATADSDNLCDFDTWNAELRTPALDFSIYTNVSMTFRSRLRLVFNNDLEEGNVEVSTNNGASWTSVYSSLTTQPNGGVLVNVNLSAFDLTPNVRIRWRYVDDLTCAWYWQIDDILVSGTLAPPCTSPPTAGTAIVDDPAVCAGSNVTLSLTGGTNGLGQTFQWQSSPDNITWTNVAGANSGSLSQVLNANTWFRAIVTCGGVNDTSNAVLASTDFTACYCAPTHNDFGATDCAIDYIANVTFNTINNSSTCGGASPFNYTDYSSISTVVFPGSSYPISVTTDGDTEGIGAWIDYDHSGTFDASEFVLSGFTGNQPETYTGNVNIPVTALTGPTRMRLRCRYNMNVGPGDACTTFTYGEVEEYTIIIAPPPADDAGAIAVLSPEMGACSVSSTLSVRLNNAGTNALTAATFNVTVNNGAVQTFAWTGNIPAQSSDSVFVGTITIVDGDVLKVWTTNPNGVADVFAFNDTITTTVYEALSGIYTVGGATPDFADVNEAKDALILRGICADVFMNIRTGIYGDQMIFDAMIPGAVNGNRAYFQSETGNADDVVFENPGIFGQNYCFYFDGTANITVRDLSFGHLSASSSNGILVMNTDSIVIDGNKFYSDTTASNTDADNYEKVAITTIVNSPSFDFGASTNLVIINNKIWGGGRGIIAYEDFQTAFTTGLRITGNEFYGPQNAISMFGQIAPVVNDNYIVLSPYSSLFSGGIFARGVIEGADFSGNYIADTASGRGYGIVLALTLGSTANPMRMTNNFIVIDDASGTDNQGIYIRTDAFGPSTLFNIYNNSIYVSGLNSSNGIFIEQSNYNNNAKLYNNNIHAGGDAYVMEIQSQVALSESDYNNFFGDNNFISYDGTDYATLAAYQSASANDPTSVNVNPAFNIAALDLHTCVEALNNTGLVIPGIGFDFDGDTRTQTPDIGADEFFTPASFSLGPDTIKCPADSVFLGAEIVVGGTYYWSPYFQSTPSIYASAPGLYVAQATSGCGVAVDSVLVTNSALPVASFNSSVSFSTGVFTNTSTNSTSYQWDFGDGNSSTDMSPSHVYANNGTYTVTLTAYNQCGDSVTTTTTVTINVQYASIESELLGNVNVYPNPSEGYFNVTFANNSNNDIRMTVTDLSGRTVSIQNFGAAAGAFAAPVDIRGMAAGTYFLKIESGSASVMKKLVVK